MIVSTRAAMALGLGLLGTALLVVPSLGQQPQDNGVRKTAGQGGSAPRTPAPAIVGSVDLGVVFKEYAKAKVLGEEFQAAAKAKQGELLKIRSEMQAEAELMQKLAPGSASFKQKEDRLTELKAKMEAAREQAERDFATRQAELMSTLYKEVQEMVATVAQWKGLTYVIKVSNEPISGQDPNTVMAAMERTIVYADPRNDITPIVVATLNRDYKANGGQVPKTSSGATATKPGSSR